MTPDLSCDIFCRQREPIEPAEEALRCGSGGEGGGTMKRRSTGGESAQSRAVHLIGLSFKGTVTVGALRRYTLTRCWSKNAQGSTHCLIPEARQAMVAGGGDVPL